MTSIADPSRRVELCAELEAGRIPDIFQLALLRSDDSALRALVARTTSSPEVFAAVFALDALFDAAISGVAANPNLPSNFGRLLRERIFVTPGVTADAVAWSLATHSTDWSALRWLLRHGGLTVRLAAVANPHLDLAAALEACNHPDPETAAAADAALAYRNAQGVQ